jgi:phosphotriesterase-related protein
MVISHDANCYFDWYDKSLMQKAAPNWHFSFIPEVVIPALRKAGVNDEQIRTMTEGNPRRIFEQQGAY